MRKSISRYLWSTIDTPKCTVDTLKYLQQQSKEDAIKHFETAFKNCKNRKSCNAAKLNQLKAYEILFEQFLNSNAAEQYFLDNQLTNEIINQVVQRDIYHTSVAASYYEEKSSSSSRKRKFVNLDTEVEVEEEEETLNEDNEAVGDNENNMISEQEQEALNEIEQEEAVAELLKSNPEESFDSIDMHTSRQYKLEYLNGNGQLQWERKAESTPLPNEISSLSDQLKNYREKSIIGAKYHKNISDCRILSLSFIFAFSHNEAGRNLCECIDGISCDVDCSTRISFKSLHTPKVFNNLYKLQELDDFDDSYFVDYSLPSVMQKILNNFYNYLKQWNTSLMMTENQFSEQAVFTLVLPLFEFKCEFEVSKYDKAMSDCSYKPDLLVKLNIKKNVQVDFFCVEIKKPNGNLCNQYETDFVKIHREMKIIIDQQVEFGINDPTAYSLLVEGYDFSLFVMKLDYDGEYRSKLVGKCRTIRDRDDLLLLSRAIDMMFYLNEKLQDLKNILVNKANERGKQESPKSKFRRPSFSRSTKKF